MVNSFFKVLQKSLKNILTIVGKSTKDVAMGCICSSFCRPRIPLIKPYVLVILSNRFLCITLSIRAGGLMSALMPQEHTSSHKAQALPPQFVILKRFRNETSSAYAYRVLEYNILMLHMPPGAWIRERNIAEKLNISRTPVHEAIGLLRDRRLVDVTPQSATHVSRIDVQTLRQGIFLRSVVEPTVMGQLIGNASPDLLANLRENIAVQKQLIKTLDDVHLYARVSSEFWEMLYREAHKGYVWDVLYQATVSLERLRYISLLHGFITPTTHSYQELYTFIALGIQNTVGLNQTIHREIHAYVQHLDSVMQQFSDYFVGTSVDDKTVEAAELRSLL